MLLAHLQVFCDIIETRSFSKAAARNFISQPAVSQQVKTLEQHFHQKLIERSSHGIAPTEAGRVLYRGALEILDRYRTLEQQMIDLSDTVAGAVRIMTVYSVGLHDLPPYVKRFMQAYPRALLHVEYSRTNKIYESVRLGRCDIGIVAYPEENSQLGVVPLNDDELVLAVSPNHPLAHRTAEVDWSALQDERFISFERDIPTRRAVDRLLRDRGVEVEVVAEFDNVETIKRSVEAGVGVSIIPRRTADLEVRTGTLVALSLEGRPTRPVGVIFRKGRSFTITLKKLLAILTESEGART